MPFFIPANLQSGGLIRSNGIILLIDISDKLVIGSQSRPFDIGKLAVVGDEGLIITNSLVTRYIREYIADNYAVYEAHSSSAGHTFKIGNTAIFTITGALASFIANVIGSELTAKKKFGNIERRLSLVIENDGVSIVADSPEENVKLRLKSGAVTFFELNPQSNRIDFGGRTLSNVGAGSSETDAATIADLEQMVRYSALDSEGLPIVYVSPLAATENAAISQRALRTVATPVKSPVEKVTGNYTASVHNKYIICEVGTSRTVTLPLAVSSVGTELIISRSAASDASATVTILCSGSDRIHPGILSSVVLSNDWQSVSLVAVEESKWLKTSEIAGVPPILP